MDKTQNNSRSSLLGIFINILLPVLILDYCSAGPANPLERPAGKASGTSARYGRSFSPFPFPWSMESVPWSSPGNLT
ncbi:hypothetical protein PVA48_08655 [Akkermansia sp. JRP_AM1]|uniref:hypothetical protein n=1 Tax=Akkermansia sp. JRP_AM1 TaxID=3414159 RepID=UPI003BFA7743